MRLLPDTQHRATPVYHGFDPTGCYRLTEVKALDLFAACIGDGVELIDRFNSFGHRAHLHPLSQARNRMDDGNTVLSFGPVEVSDERAVDLDLIEREATQIAERRIGCTEIVEGKFDAKRPEFV